MKKNSCKKLTFILPIKERREFTIRFFKYLATINFPYKLFIADGSKKSLSPKYLDILKISKIDFTYHKFPFDHDYRTYTKKKLNSLKLIKTKYVVLFSDDDFPIISSFNKLLLFLERSKTYIACGGYAFNFDLLKQTNHKNEIYGHPINFGRMMNAKSNDKKDGTKRLSQYLEVMENSWHYIFRTKILLDSYKIIHRKKTSFINVDFYDFLQDGNNFFSGRVKKINILTFLHQFHLRSAVNARLKFERMIQSKSFVSDIKKLYANFKSIVGHKRMVFLKKSFFESKIFFPKNKKLSLNITNKRKHFNFKGFITRKLFKHKIINLFYSLYLNKMMYLNNKHINKIMRLLDSKKTKNELNNIFNFLKKN
jgi:glycosyltransferase domain-containing protein